LVKADECVACSTILSIEAVSTNEYAATLLSVTALDEIMPVGQTKVASEMTDVMRAGDPVTP
jgi:hypothetical protein